MIRSIPNELVTARLTDPEHALSLADLTVEIRDNDVLVLAVPNSAISFDEAFEAVFEAPDEDVGQRMSVVWLSEDVEVARETLLVTDVVEDPGYVVGVPAELYLENAPSGLSLTAQLLDNGELVQAIDEDAIVFDEAYVATWIPELAGRYTVVWFDGATEVGSEVIDVGTGAIVQPWTPETIEVAARMFARVMGETGPVHDFEIDGRPSRAQAQEAVAEAVSLLAPQVGFDLDVEFHATARTLAILLSAMLLEPSYWPEDIDTPRSAWEQWEKLYETGLAALLVAIGEAGSGDEVGPGDDHAHVAYGFPPVPAYARRDDCGAFPVW